jgi:hypothetical protein
MGVTKRGQRKNKRDQSGWKGTVPTDLCIETDRESRTVYEQARQPHVAPNVRHGSRTADLGCPYYVRLSPDGDGLLRHTKWRDGPIDNIPPPVGYHAVSSFGVAAPFVPLASQPMLSNLNRRSGLLLLCLMGLLTVSARCALADDENVWLH